MAKQDIAKTDPRMDALMLKASQKLMEFWEREMPALMEGSGLSGSIVITSRNMSFGANQGFEHDELWLLSSISYRPEGVGGVVISDKPTTVVPTNTPLRMLSQKEQ